MSGLERRVSRLERTAGARRASTAVAVATAQERLLSAARGRLAEALEATRDGRDVPPRRDGDAHAADVATTHAWCARHGGTWPVEGARERLAGRVERKATRGA